MRILGDLMLHAKIPLSALNCTFSIHMPISSCLVYWLVCINSSNWLRFNSGPHKCAHLRINRNRMAISSQQCHQIPEIQGVQKKGPFWTCWTLFVVEKPGLQLFPVNQELQDYRGKLQTWFLNHEQGPGDSEKSFFLDTLKIQKTWFFITNIFAPGINQPARIWPYVLRAINHVEALLSF